MVGLKRLIELALPWRRGIMAVVDEARELLTVSDMAERCHVSRQTIYAWMAEGRLVPVARYRYGDQWAPLFDPADAVGRRDRRRKTRA